MNKNIITFLMLAFAMPSMAQYQRATTFADQTITVGGSKTIDGVNRTEPDIYFKEEGGKLTATRLTVKPGAAASYTQPYLINATPTSIQINWKSKAKPGASDGTVKYGTASNSLTSTSAKAAVTQITNNSYYWNSVMLSNLQPNTTYYYQVTYKAGSTSEIYSFRTPANYADTGKYRVLIVGDRQRNNQSSFEWLLQSAKRVLDSKYGTKNIEDHVCALMSVGDQVDVSTDADYENVMIFKSRQMMSNIPVMTAVGNHEGKLVYTDGYNASNVAKYDSHFSSYGKLDYKGIKSGTARYYAYQVRRTLFVVLNSNEESDAQREWVRKVVTAADADETVDFIVSIQHHPIYAEQFNSDVSRWMSIVILPILSTSRKHVLNAAGHHHLYARGQMRDYPMYHMITGGGSGSSDAFANSADYEQLWNGEQAPGARNEEMVQKTIDHWIYQIVEFDPATKKMSVETYSIGNSRMCLKDQLIDSFSRDVDDFTKSLKPELAEITSNTLPMTIEQTNSVEGLHSAQYQIATDEEFRNIIYDHVLTFEDIYGVNDDYTPKDKAAGKSIGVLQLAGGDLYNGTYYVRSRNRNMNLNWSNYSAVKQFTVTGQEATGDGLATTKKFYKTNEPITISWVGATANGKDWVGIYKANGDKPSGSNASLQWTYANPVSGSKTFNAMSAGAYYAALLKNDGYDEIQRVYFVVSDKGSYEITTDKQVYKVGDVVKVNVANAPAFDRDWIGIYSIMDNEKGLRDAKSTSYAYVSSANGGWLELNKSGNYNFQSAIPAGDYFVGYAFYDNYEEIFDRCYFSVREDNPTDYTANMSIGSEHISTFVAPFDVTIPDGVTAYTLNDMDRNEPGTILIEALDNMIPAYTPVLVYSTSTVNRNFSNKAYALNPVSDGLLTGVFSQIAAETGSYVLDNHNGNVAFYIVGEDKHPNINPSRAYVRSVPDEVADAQMLNLVFQQTTAIADTEIMEVSKVIYDMLGRRVQTPARGINIINGKKVLTLK